VRAVEIVQRLVAVLYAEIHERRVAAVCRAVAAVVQGGRATLTGIGRAMDGKSVKHLIKAADRLLGNLRLHSELLLFYGVLSRNVLPRNGRPILLVDWTDIGTLWAVLAVTLVTEGRGIVVFAEAHPRRRENSARVESHCLRVLAKLLGDAKPIVVTDAGFRGPWMARVRDSGWDFVGRVRGRVDVSLGDEATWRTAKSLWCEATTRPKCLGRRCQLAKSRPVPVRLVLFRQRCRTRKALPKIGRRKKKHVQSAREPWVLATSLTAASAKDVVDIYKKRMRIEETFRDQKCPRFGWGLDDVRTKSINRINVLLMLAALAHYVAMLIGAAAEACDMRKRFQANTVRTRRSLSLPRLAREALDRLPSRDLDQLLAVALQVTLPIATHK